MSESLLNKEVTETIKNETFICFKCGEEYEIDELNEFDGKELCGDCYNEHTAICDHCEDRIWYNDTINDNETDLCQYCYDSYYYRCYNCESLVHQDNAMYENYNSFCSSCYEELDRYDDNDNEESICSYNYKPYPIFYGDDAIHYGIELEVDEAGENNHNAEIILDIGNQDNDHIYIKRDSSLSEGFEIVSHPMTLQYHKGEMNWEKILEKLINLGYLSHKASTCGLHVHVERVRLGNSFEEQEKTISNILYFVEKNWYEILRFSRRTQTQIERWASRYGYKDSPREILNCAKSGNWGRYVCVNLQNCDTIEFRMFRGTLKYSTFIATLQIVDEICSVALSLLEEELKALTWSDFVRNINRFHKPELVEYLKFKSLYVNEPIDEQEEDN